MKTKINKAYKEKYDGWVDAYYNERQEQERAEYNSQVIRHNSEAFVLCLMALLVALQSEIVLVWALAIMCAAFIYKGMY